MKQKIICERCTLEITVDKDEEDGFRLHEEDGKTYHWWCSPKFSVPNQKQLKDGKPIDI